ncbi:MAG: sigma factor [Polyangiales bacterium]
MPPSTMPLDWSAQQFRDALLRYVSRRVPSHEAEDVVQSVLLEAATAAQRPDDPGSVRRWIWGIARHKIADHHRRARREAPEVAAEAPAGQDVDDLLRWATRELPARDDAHETLQWLLREADGETLDEIARDARVPATAVRQRVSRLRRHFRARHALLLAASGLLLGWLAWWASRADAPSAPRGFPSPDIAAPRVVPDASAPAALPDATTDAPDARAPAPEDVPAPARVDGAVRPARRPRARDSFGGSSGP